MELILEQITKNFGTKQVLKGASYTFAKEGIYGLLGRNGAGKTTLFNCLSAEYPPDSGKVELVDHSGTPSPSGPRGRGLRAVHPGGAGISHRL